MAYWSGEVDGSDFSFNSICVIALSIKKEMFEDVENCIRDKYPEQSVIASIRMLSQVAQLSPKILLPTVTVTDVRRAEEMLEEWFDVCGSKVPAKYREQLRQEGKDAFDELRFVMKDL